MLTSPRHPERIVCLTEETTEFLYLLGEEKRIVGISAFTCRPTQAKKEKPVVSGFTGANLPKIVELNPDLVIGFSDIQAQIAHDLIKRNIPVAIFNQRSLQDIVDTLLSIAALVGQTEKARSLISAWTANLHAVSQRKRKHRPRVYFEEWDDPMISGIRWVGELIEIAGGEDIFRDRSLGKLARDRFVKSDEVLERKPEVLIGCWCGKAFDTSSVESRPGWAALPALKNGRLYEMDPSIILQPGPACLTEGIAALEEIIHR